VDGLSVGGGLRYMASYYATQDNGRVTKGYTLADLMLSYEMSSDFSVDLGVTNLFGKDYYSVCYDDYGCSKGEGRVISLALSQEF